MENFLKENREEIIQVLALVFPSESRSRDEFISIMTEFKERHESNFARCSSKIKTKKDVEGYIRYIAKSISVHKPKLSLAEMAGRYHEN